MERPPSSQPPRDSSWVRRAGLIAAMGAGALGIIKNRNEAHADAPPTTTSHLDALQNSVSGLDRSTTTVSATEAQNILFSARAEQSPATTTTENETPESQGVQIGVAAINEFYHPEMPNLGMDTEHGTSEEIAELMYKNIMDYTAARIAPISGEATDVIQARMNAAYTEIARLLGPKLIELNRRSDTIDIAVDLAQRFGGMDPSHTYIPELTRETSGVMQVEASGHVVIDRDNAPLPTPEQEARYAASFEAESSPDEEEAP